MRIFSSLFQHKVEELKKKKDVEGLTKALNKSCLLYTSDAADE